MDAPSGRDPEPTTGHRGPSIRDTIELSRQLIAQSRALLRQIDANHPQLQDDLDARTPDDRERSSGE